MCLQCLGTAESCWPVPPYSVHSVLGTCSRSLSTISSHPHPCILLAHHCCPWVWLYCIPLLHCPIPKGQNVLSAAPGFLPGHGVWGGTSATDLVSVSGPHQGQDAEVTQLWLPCRGSPCHVHVLLSLISNTRVGGSLSAQNQKVLNDINIRHRKLD